MLIRIIVMRVVMTALAALCLSVSLGGVCHAQESLSPNASPKWSYEVTPYAFLSGFSGTIGARGRSETASASFNELLKSLKVGGMLSADGYDGKSFVFLVDVMYMALSKNIKQKISGVDATTLNTNTFMLDPEIGWRVDKAPRGYTDVLLGFRYWNANNKVDYGGGVIERRSVSQNKNWIDPVIGFRSKIALNKDWYAAFKGDVGGFGVNAKFTWQAFGTIGYAVNKNQAAIIGYRILDTDFKYHDYTFDTQLSGVTLGYNFKF